LFVKRTWLYNAFVPASSQPPQNDDPAPIKPGVIPSPPRTHRRRRPTRRTALTLDAIVAAAIQTLDEAGVAGLTMRRVADVLGTGAASLYAHVSGRDELLELAFDELVGQVPLPEPDPDRWREQLRRMLLDLYRTLIATRTPRWRGWGACPPHPGRWTRPNGWRS
jgi:AcrR family transcriptional regulator